MQVAVNGQTIELSEAGWLLDLSQWTEDVARAIAVNEKIELTDAHWAVIREARAYFEEYGVCAEPRVFAKIMKERYGPECGSQQYIYDLFPYGLIKSANKIAGLPRPKGCS